MNKVEIYSNWCYMDALDGKPLENGEVLKVKWPNGTITKETVIIESSSYTMMDHTSPWEVLTTKAYVKGRDRRGSKSDGLKTLIRLYGQNILCERLEPAPKKKEPGIIKRRGKNV